jgi:hypothetical protein
MTTQRTGFNEEFQQLFKHFPKCHMRILLGDFNVKLGREDIFQTDNWE